MTNVSFENSKNASLIYTKTPFASEGFAPLTLTRALPLDPAGGPRPQL